MSHTILLVEDDANIRQMLSIALGAEGYLCVEAASVREALSLFNQHRPRIANKNKKITKNEKHCL